MLLQGNWMTYIKEFKLRKGDPQKFTPHRARTAVTVHITQPTYTHWTPWGSVKALHQNFVFGTETDKHHKFLTPGYIYLHRIWYHIARWLVSGYRNATDLTMESRTKLAQAKSKGLTCTLITEAITSGKSWEDIKDLLWLKICNSNSHTSICHFMEI